MNTSKTQTGLSSVASSSTRLSNGLPAVVAFDLWRHQRPQPLRIMLIKGFRTASGDDRPMSSGATSSGGASLATFGGGYLNFRFWH
jgi:hypothetical protein